MDHFIQNKQLFVCLHSDSSDVTHFTNPLVFIYIPWCDKKFRSWQANSKFKFNTIIIKNSPDYRTYKFNTKIFILSVLNYSMHSQVQSHYCIHYLANPLVRAAMVLNWFLILELKLLFHCFSHLFLLHLNFGNKWHSLCSFFSDWIIHHNMLVQALHLLLQIWHSTESKKSSDTQSDYITPPSFQPNC